jgi:putative ABC transport system ATP-binding protein
MAFINHTNKKITATIIFYGTDLAGKNASLVHIYNHLPEEDKGKLVSMATEQGNKVNFAFHARQFDKNGYSFFVQLNAVSGNVNNETLRRSLVEGADGCVFVADMQPSCQFANFKCYQNLEQDLGASGRNLRDFPLIIQYNKMDVPNVLPVGKMNLFLNSYSVQFFETSAITGTGILEVLDGITKLVWKDLDKNNFFGLTDDTTQTKLDKETQRIENRSEEYDELEVIDLSDDSTQTGFESADLTEFPFEEAFVFEELINLADHIAPKQEDPSDTGSTQKIDQGTSSQIAKPPQEKIVEVTTPIQLQEEPFEFPSPTIEEIAAETEAEPEPLVEIESATQIEEEVVNEPEPVILPEQISTPEPVVDLEATIRPQMPIVVQTVSAPTAVPAAVADSLFGADRSLHTSFALLEDAISKKDFGEIKTLSDKIYSELIDKFCVQKGITRDQFKDGSLWFQEIGIPSSQYLLYRKAAESLASQQQAALSDLFLIHHFLLFFHTRLSSATELPTRVAKKLVAIDRVSKRYTLGNYQVHALRNVTMDVKDGEFLAIAGPSGSGKTTLLNLIGCIDTPSSGTITIEECIVNSLNSDELADLRARSIGFIFQNFNLLPVLSAAENVEYPLLQIREISKPERKERVNHYLSMVHLSSVANHRPNELSGGQRQRVAIARALAAHPKIVLADEPTANLDHKTGESILQLMKEINRLEKTTFIFSTHDHRVMEIADRLVQINDGEIV